MTHKLSDIETGKKVVRIEADSVASLVNKIGPEFQKAVDIIYQCKGRVVITGMGKSGLIARKIVATMNSTGTPSIFLHPSDAVHGDLGMVRDGDVVICISKSGETQEINQLLPLFKRIRVPIIAMTGNTRSYLAKQSEVALDISVKEEACPHDLAPTASTTVTVALGDALAVTLLEKKDFTADDFAQFHPGGNLGKRLLLRIEEFAITGEQVPKVHIGASLRDAILEISSKRIGATCVVDDSGKLEGIITDGDLRRLLQKTTDVANLTAQEVMTKNPKSVKKGMLAASVLQEMEHYSITQIIVLDGDRNIFGLVHLHDLVRAGLGGDSSA